MPVTTTAFSGDAAFQPQVGQVLQGMIQATDEGLFLIAGQVRVAVPVRSGLTAGQPVSAEVVTRNVQDGSIQLRIMPQTPPSSTLSPTPSPTPSSIVQTALADMADAVLRALGAVDVPENPAPLLPAQLPVTPETARAALSFFAVRARLGSDIVQILARIQDAVQAGVSVQPETRAAAALLNRLVASEPDSFEPVLRQWLSEAGTPTEARVVQALTAGSPERLSALMQTDVRAALAQMRHDTALVNHVRVRGELPAFQDALGRVADRITGGQLQNVRGIDIPYWVSEIPFAPGGGIRDGLVHFLPDERHAHGASGSGYATIALDLSTTRLGNLWVTIQAGGGECHCRVQAAQGSAVEALRAAATELEAGLVHAGYARPTVQIAGWDGNRLRETTALLRRYAGFQVNA